MRTPLNRLLPIFRSFVRRGIIYWLPLALLLTTALAHLVIPEEFDQLSSLVAFDVHQRIAQRQAPADTPVVIVDIDEHSLEQIGQWPWPRTVLAQLVDKLGKAGAAVIAFDVLFSEPDRTSPKMLLSLLTDRGTSEADAKRLLASMADPDEEFAKAIGEAPVVVGFNLTGADGKGDPAIKAGFSWVGEPGANPLKFVRSFPDAVSALPQLQKAAAGNGFVNQISDWDNVVRRVPVAAATGGQGGSLARRRGVARGARGIGLYRPVFGRPGSAKLWREHRAERHQDRPAGGADRRQGPGRGSLYAANSARSGSPLHLGGQGFSPAISIPRGSPSASCWSARRRPGSTI